MSFVLILLRLTHVLGAFIWAGWAFSAALFLTPAAAASGQAGGTFMGNLLKTSFLKVMTIVPLLVVGAGLILYGILYGPLGMDYFTSFRGIMLSLGALVGIAAFLEGFFVIRPTANKMLQLGEEMGKAGGPPSPEQVSEMGALSAKMTKVGKRSAILLLITLLGMILGAH